MFRNYALPCFIVTALCLSLGCGGSDGVGSVTISEQNAHELGGTSLDSVGLVEDMGDLVEDFSEVFEDGAAAVILCDSGNVGSVVNDAAPQGELSTGDSATFDFNACQFQGATLNGGLQLEVLEATGTETGPFSVVLRASFDSLSVTTLGATFIVDGGFTVDVSSTSLDGSTVTVVVSGTYFSSFAQVGDQSFSGTLRNFRFERTETIEGFYTQSVDATVDGSEIDGRIVIKTIEPFVGVGENDPNSGSMSITGANGATIVITATGGGGVEMELDVNGDDSTDVTIITTFEFVENEPGNDGSAL